MDLDKYVRDLAELEGDHPDRLGAMIAASLVDHPHQDRVLAAFWTQFPQATAEASAQLVDLRTESACGPAAEARAREALRKRASSARSLWPWAAGTLGILILAVVWWNWRGGSSTVIHAPVPPPQPTPAPAYTPTYAPADSRPAAVPSRRSVVYEEEHVAVGS